METMTEFFYFYIIVILLIVVICYATLAIFLTHFSEKVEGKPSVMAWIPFANIYLLGKLTFNKDTGYGLVALFVLSYTLTLQIEGIIQMILGAAFAGAFVAVLIFGVRKYDRLNSSKDKGNNTKSNKEIEEIVKANDKFFNN